MKRFFHVVTAAGLISLATYAQPAPPPAAPPVPHEAPAADGAPAEGAIDHKHPRGPRPKPKPHPHPHHKADKAEKVERAKKKHNKELQKAQEPEKEVPAEAPVK